MIGTYRDELIETSRVVATDPDDLPPGVDPDPDEPANPYMVDLRERGLLEDYVEDMEDRLFMTVR